MTGADLPGSRHGGGRWNGEGGIPAHGMPPFAISGKAAGRPSRMPQTGSFVAADRSSISNTRTDWGGICPCPVAP